MTMANRKHANQFHGIIVFSHYLLKWEIQIILILNTRLRICIYICWRKRKYFMQQLPSPNFTIGYLFLGIIVPTFSHYFSSSYNMHCVLGRKSNIPKHNSIILAQRSEFYNIFAFNVSPKYVPSIQLIILN